ncbi:unnamed protein product [Didymodactylos carnosus]|uniref:N-acetyltransferase domain-containing protein n=1 Tax=Didymodactylos carnosus TaxID=1234261 RepID=A0A815E7C0_9BILA|nr:unnamed protein product [Didymodactylos carnosus]CAF1340093.1 unnamed protein product [Didymodactylos carnosus]CAF4140133.1 unnamed protein product [Didymodactylos carnosus]CAF4151409.1 unnamed protein product [Didymodactylos carnosus]
MEHINAEPKQFSSELVEYRPLTYNEQSLGLTHWETIFGFSRDCFERYYSLAASPDYQVGDTLGAWYQRSLISTVHICRLKCEWNDEIFLCGGIALVATLAEYRCHGLSRHLLNLAIEKMKNEGFHFSFLGTDQPGHYAALDWEESNVPYLTIKLNEDNAGSMAKWSPFDVCKLIPIYKTRKRPLQFQRSKSYFEHWVGWDWRRTSAIVNIIDDGYIVLSAPDEEEKRWTVIEWKAPNEDTENVLFKSAASEALKRGTKNLRIDTLPQYLDKQHFRELGHLTEKQNNNIMLRNINLPMEKYKELLQLYESGKAVWWRGDWF